MDEKKTVMEDENGDGRRWRRTKTEIVTEDKNRDGGHKPWRKTKTVTVTVFVVNNGDERRKWIRGQDENSDRNNGCGQKSVSEDENNGYGPDGNDGCGENRNGDEK